MDVVDRVHRSRENLTKEFIQWDNIKPEEVPLLEQLSSMLVLVEKIEDYNREIHNKMKYINKMREKIIRTGKMLSEKERMISKAYSRKEVDGLLARLVEEKEKQDEKLKEMLKEIKNAPLELITEPPPPKLLFQKEGDPLD